ncbi:arylsulfatase [Paraflavitalea sp. CAU 1676]|uniref:arylsulfatase n=1 Tax=Paraflavitalea sp. CAU 1676 TaxID=3032598 RepID=UPI0023DB4014|nr:arylsulfatase [Paraflavitalea sp. CAU 1676]MDF2187309.1 arylsulfatase [Paraflavitalea sp. CAU 1676]
MKQVKLKAGLIVAIVACSTIMLHAQNKKPNILVIWGDDVGYWNISAYNLGMMGYKTPNIDRIAKEGALFTDWYGQQSCTAGRACFITGQVGFRTGMLKVGLPGAKEGLQARDVTIAELLKGQGYVTGQFGKNHLGDADATLPTAHGFDEFYGSLYHLNAEQEPENPDYFKDPELRKKYGTRGVLHTWANPDGTQKIELTGALSTKRMETVDEEFTREALRFMTDASKSGKPFFLWWNSTRMHIFTHLKKESEGKTGLGTYPDGMVEHDAMVGQLLDKLKELGLDENTIVMYSTDNGAEKFTWPDGGTSPFRGEKNTNWEGGYRVPCAIRWPGVIKPGTINNDIFAHEDMLPTLLAAVGVSDVKNQLLKGMKVGSKTFKVHLDGYNITDALAGKTPSPRKEFFYFNDDGSLVGLRYNQWKIVFAEQRAEGFDVWQEPFVPLRLPKVFNLRSDPFEEGDKEAMDYGHWRADRIFLLVPAQEYVGRFLASFKEFPPSQKPGSFSIDDALEKLQQSGNN